MLYLFEPLRVSNDFEVYNLAILNTSNVQPVIVFTCFWWSDFDHCIASSIGQSHVVDGTICPSVRVGCCSIYTHNFCQIHLKLIISYLRGIAKDRDEIRNYQFSNLHQFLPFNSDIFSILATYINTTSASHILGNSLHIILIIQKWEKTYYPS